MATPQRVCDNARVGSRVMHPGDGLNGACLEAGVGVATPKRACGIGLVG